MLVPTPKLEEAGDVVVDRQKLGELETTLIAVAPMLFIKQCRCTVVEIGSKQDESKPHPIYSVVRHRPRDL